jgi:uncharacterized protein (DUF433 family)
MIYREVRMNVEITNLSAAETATAAGVSVADVNRAVDRNILPEGLFSASGSRTFRREACVFISFYFRTADSLTSAARLRVIRDGSANSTNWSDLKAWRSKESGAVEVSFSPFIEEVEGRLDQLLKAQEMVVEDPEILRGIPVFRGTRIPVQDVADLIEEETPVSELMELYPRLNQSHFDLAPVYAKAHPRRGRPVRRIMPKALLVSTTKQVIGESTRRGRKRDQATH